MPPRKLLAIALILLGTWGLAATVAVPILVARDSGLPLTSLVSWEAWWFLHLVLAGQLLRPVSLTWFFAVVVAWADIGITAAKLALFRPELDSAVGANLLAYYCARLVLLAILAWYLHASPGGRELRSRQ